MEALNEDISKEQRELKNVSHKIDKFTNTLHWFESFCSSVLDLKKAFDEKLFV